MEINNDYAELLINLLAAKATDLKNKIIVLKEDRECYRRETEKYQKDLEEAQQEIKKTRDENYNLYKQNLSLTDSLDELTKEKK